MTAREHAARAAELLASVDTFSDELASMTEEQRLHAAISGGLKRANADLHWTVELASAHALTSIAVGLAVGGSWEGL